MTSDWEAVELNGDVRRLSKRNLYSMKVKDFIDGNYAMKFNLESGRVYFVGNDEAYEKVKDRGTTMFLHEIFCTLYDKLITNGLQTTPRQFLGWTVGEVLEHKNAQEIVFEVFPGARAINRDTK